eukprot:scaffold207435_cov32-Tisochrysis_lutea.AAC.2
MRGCCCMRRRCAEGELTFCSGVDARDTLSPDGVVTREARFCVADRLQLAARAERQPHLAQGVERVGMLWKRDQLVALFQLIKNVLNVRQVRSRTAQLDAIEWRTHFGFEQLQRCERTRKEGEDELPRQLPPPSLVLSHIRTEGGASVYLVLRECRNFKGYAADGIGKAVGKLVNRRLALRSEH